VSVDFESEEVVCVRVVGVGVAGSGAKRLETLYGCRKINVDTELKYGRQEQRAGVFICGRRG
jgi:hypothetical protein